MPTNTTHSTNHTADNVTTPNGRSRREEKLAEARAVLERGLSDVREDPGVLAVYLRFRSHFRDYSVQNALLIQLQRPSTRFCMGYKAWQKHGRQVRRGERGLMIYAPILRRPTDEEIQDGADPERRVVAGYRVTHTFDYGQTDAVTDDALTYEAPTPRLNEDGYEGLAGRLEAVARSIGYAVSEGEPGTPGLGYADGVCSFRDRRITLAAGLSSADRAAVLAHELAHALAHGRDGKADDEAVAGEEEGGARPDAVARELQAEGAAYAALYALGLDTSRASLPYLRDWAGGDARLLAELGAIDRIAADLLARLDAVEGEPVRAEPFGPESFYGPVSEGA